VNSPTYTAYLEGSLRLSATGEWWHEGVAFTHPELIALFHRSIVWDAGTKRYLVRIGEGAATFTCEDTAYFVATLLTEQTPWYITLLDGTIEPLDPAMFSLGTDNQIYCRVKGGHRARLTRGAHQNLLCFAIDAETLLIGDVPVKLRRCE
jgi:hypothetical protein